VIIDATSATGDVKELTALLSNIAIRKERTEKNSTVLDASINEVNVCGMTSCSVLSSVLCTF